MRKFIAALLAVGISAVALADCEGTTDSGAQTVSQRSVYG